MSAQKHYYTIIPSLENTSLDGLRELVSPLKSEDIEELKEIKAKNGQDAAEAAKQPMFDQRMEEQKRALGPQKGLITKYLKSVGTTMHIVPTDNPEVSDRFYADQKPDEREIWKRKHIQAEPHFSSMIALDKPLSQKDRDTIEKQWGFFILDGSACYKLTQGSAVNSNRAKPLIAHFVQESGALDREDDKQNKTVYFRYYRPLTSKEQKAFKDAGMALETVLTLPKTLQKISDDAEKALPQSKKATQNLSPA